MKIQLISFLSLIVLTGHIEAQLPSNYELLDHTVRISYPGASHIVSDTMYYVTHNGYWPMTELKFSDSFNQIRTVFNSPFSGRSKLVHNRDNTSDIFIYQLFDYDVGIPGYYKIHFDSGNVSIDTFTFGSDIDFLTYDLYTYDIVKDSSDYIWILNDGSVSRLNDKEIDIRFDFSQSYNYRFFQNNSGDIYLYSQNKLIHLTSTGLEYFEDLEKNIIDIALHDSGNYVLHEDQLLRYDTHMDSILDSWDLPFLVTDAEMIDLFENEVFLINENGTSFELGKIDTLKNYEVLLSNNSDDEFPVGLEALSDSSFLLKAVHREASAFSIPFFRMLSSGSEPEYSRLTLDIEEFKIHRAGKDSIFHYVTSSGDSIFRLGFLYDYSIKLKNNSDIEILSSNLFSREFHNWPFDVFGPAFDLELPETMAPNSNLLIQNRLIVYQNGGNLTDLVIYAPGANNRFNDSPMSSILGDYTSSIFEPALALKTIHLYPNPCSDLITLDPGLKVSHYSIYDMNGILVQAGIPDFSKIDLIDLPKGCYILKARDMVREELYLSRFVKF